MITCKEDLINTYIVNDCDVKRERYFELCGKFGIEFEISKRKLHSNAYGVIHGLDSGVWDNLDDYTMDRCQELHLSDLFPENLVNTKVYSTNEEVVRMYAELIGVKYKMDHGRYSAAGYAYREITLCVECFRSGYKVDKFWDEITEPQIRALHREKFPEQYAEPESQYVVLRKGGRYTFEHGKPVDFGDVVGCFKCSDSVKPLPSTFFDGPKESEMKFDYELIERIGATHYLPSVEDLYKVIGDKLMFWGADGLWIESSSPAAWAINNLKPIPPKPQTKVTYELVTGMDTNEIAKAMIDGEVLYSKDGGIEYSWNGKYFCQVTGGVDNVNSVVSGDYYRRVEAEVDWLGAAKAVNPSLIGDDNVVAMGTVCRSKFLETCRATLRGTGELE